MLEIDILRNSSKIFWVSLGVLFKDLGVQKDTQLAKTMMQSEHISKKIANIKNLRQVEGGECRGRPVIFYFYYLFQVYFLQQIP